MLLYIYIYNHILIQLVGRAIFLPVRVIVYLEDPLLFNGFILIHGPYEILEGFI